jgi:hypothetical protein
MSTTPKTITTGSELFNNYLNKFKDEVRSKSSDKYYHVDVVAEAYSQGFSDGEKSGKKEFIEDMIKAQIEKISQKANQVYILTNLIVSNIKESGYSVDSFHINIFHNSPQVIIAVKNELLLNDDFVNKAYSKVFEMKRVFNELFGLNLDMGITGSENLDLQSLSEDGFEYSEDLI